MDKQVPNYITTEVELLCISELFVTVWHSGIAMRLSILSKMLTHISLKKIKGKPGILSPHSGETAWLTSFGQLKFELPL